MKLLENYNNLKENKIVLKSKSKKGNKIFKQLKTCQFQHYDMPKGELSYFRKGEEDRKRLVSKLSKEDKKLYREWLKTDEGEISKNLFLSNCTTCDKSVNESFMIFKEKTFKEKVINSLVDIVMDENSVSEKDFTRYDIIIEMVTKLVNENEHILDIIKKYELKNCRVNLVSEIIYQSYKNIIKLS